MSASSHNSGTSASNPLPSTLRSSAFASPLTVGAADRAGYTNAKSSSRSYAGPGRIPNRRKLAGACTNSGGAMSRRIAAASGVGTDNSSPSGVRMAVRPCPTTIAGA